MTEIFDPRKPATAFDQDSTLVVALELSGKSWELGAVVPGVSRRPMRGVKPREMGDLLATIERWKAEAARADRTVTRVVVGYEAGRDGFWIARSLQRHGIEMQIMQAASIAVERRGRRVKTDRIDLDMLLRTLLAWLRGEPRVCSMVRIPSEAEEDLRRPGRERERLVSERIAIENRIGNLLCLHGTAEFKPRLKKAAEKLEALRGWSGAPLPAKLMDELRRLMARHRLLTEQIKAIEAERDQVVAPSTRAQEAAPDREAKMIRLLVTLVGLGLETATTLVREVLCRPFRDRRAVAAFAGLTGTPFRSGAMEREQGISKNGNPRVRRILMQLAWRWLRFQPESALSRWFARRTADAKGRIRKIMIVALARKLLVALWRLVETGQVLEGARTAA
jgi:transposase